jgi:hypothetical protein
MATKAFRTFTNRLAYFDDDIELVDVIRIAIISGDLSDKKSDLILNHVNPEIHKHLARRKNSDGARKLISSHIRKTIYSAYVKDIYEELTEYLRTILRQATEKGLNSGRLIGEHTFKVDGKAVLELKNWDNLCAFVADNVFQSLESERSTLKLLEKIASKLDLKVDKNKILLAIPYLEARHFLVHADGKLSDAYIAEHPHIEHQENYLKLNYKFITQFRKTISELIEDYDKSVISAEIVDKAHQS